MVRAQTAYFAEASQAATICANSGLSEAPPTSLGVAVGGRSGLGLGLGLGLGGRSGLGLGLGLELGLGLGPRTPN